MLDLLDPSFIVAMGQVLTYGANKYDRNNWKGGFRWGRLFAAVLRHLWAFWSKEDIDPESGLPHLAHAAVSLMFLWWHTRHRPDLDDRVE